MVLFLGFGKALLYNMDLSILWGGWGGVCHEIALKFYVIKTLIVCPLGFFSNTGMLT